MIKSTNIDKNPAEFPLEVRVLMDKLRVAIKKLRLVLKRS